MVEKRSFLRLLQSSETSIQDQRVGGPAWETERLRKTHKRNGAEIPQDEGNGVGRKVEDGVGGNGGEKKNRRKDNRHRKGAWSMSRERQRGREVVPSIAPSAQRQCHEERGEPGCW